MVTERLPWSETAAAWIRDAMAINMPLFGVCYGHRLMAHALSGQLGYHPVGREVGTQTVRLLPAAAEDGLVSVMRQEFASHLTHMQTVLDLPPGAQVLAASDHDPHQIVRYGSNSISTQFHPEFTPEISRAVIHLRSDALRGEGKDPDALMAAASPAPEPVSLLRRFVEGSLGRDPRPELSATATET